MILPVRVALCDVDAVLPFGRLLSGGLLQGDLRRLERFIRTTVLHDDLRMLSEGLTWSAEDRYVIHVEVPIVPGFEILGQFYDPACTARTIDSNFLVTDLERNLLWLRIAASLENLQEGGSVLEGEVEEALLDAAQQYPEALFRGLDDTWQEYARNLAENGFQLAIPPVLGIVLSRCARREAIPIVIRDLREEWASARKKVWHLFDTLRDCHTLGDALELTEALSEASNLFAPQRTEHDSRPIRTFWELAAAAAAGAAIASMAGGHTTVGAATGAMAHAPRSVPALLHEFGPAIFGRGAFDLASRVRRAAAGIDFNSLRRLITDEEMKALGF